MNRTDRWEDFIHGLTVAKAEGRNKGLQVPPIITLIYAGAFDGMARLETSDFATYGRMVEEVRKALDSEAKPAKAKKGDLVGLADVVATKDDSLLHLWRWTINPLYEFDLLGKVKEASANMGFVEGLFPEPFIAMSSVTHRKKVLRVFLTDRWSEIFESPANLRAFQYDAALAIPMIVTETESRMYGKADERKERWCFKGYTGHEFTDEISMWPDLGNEVSDARKSMVGVRKMGIAVIQISVYNGRRSGSLIKWLPLTRISRGLT